MKKHSSQIDVPVLMIFFCRDEQFRQVFESVKLARPSKLYLYQDGPRDSKPNDLIGIQKCRDIVDDKNIDWECEVHRLYQDENYGCDPSGYIAQKWLFQNEEIGIVLEDDVVPAQSFFPYCKELLEKYRYDSRINMICGMNNTGTSKHTNDSYLFTKKGSIWGWASWRRVTDSWDKTYAWLNNPDQLSIIRPQLNRRDYHTLIDVSSKHNSSGRAHHESINAASMYLYDRLNIVPKYNMISNIGIAEESTHSTNDIRLLPQRIRKLFFMKTYEIDFPLKHPQEIKRDYRFERKMSPSRFRLMLEKIEHLIYVFRYKGINETFRFIRNKIIK